MNKIMIVATAAAVVLSTAAVTVGADNAGGKNYQRGYNVERFNKADTNGDGFLTKEEAGALMKGSEGYRGRDRFEAADTDKDGLLSMEEASAWKAREKQHGTERAREAQDMRYKRARFDEADTDGDGFVSREEASADKRAYDLFGGKRFDRADKDGDGKLSLEEARQHKAAERKKF